MNIRSTLVAALVSALPALAQGTCIHVPTDTPASGPCSSIPLGGRISQAAFRSQRIQVVVTAAELGNAPRSISTLGVAPCGDGIRTYGRLQIEMGHINAPLTTTFANNGTGLRGVLDRSRYDWVNTAGRWNNIGLDRVFDYDPANGDLLIEITIRNAGFSGSTPEMRSDARPCLYASGFSATPRTGTLTNTSFKLRVCDGVGAVDRFGVGCGPGPLQIDVTGSPRLGGRLDMRLTGGNPSAVPSLGAIFLGFRRGLSGLTSDCALYVPAELSQNTTVRSGVSTVFSLMVPTIPDIVGGKVYVQGANLYPDPRVVLELFATSDYVAVTIGS